MLLPVQYAAIVTSTVECYFFDKCITQSRIKTRMKWNNSRGELIFALISRHERDLLTRGPHQAHTALFEGRSRKVVVALGRYVRISQDSTKK
jgi:hypothetical protein